MFLPSNLVFYLLITLIETILNLTFTYLPNNLFSTLN